MSNVVYTDDLFDFENLSSFSVENFELKSSKSNLITFADDKGASMVLHGTGIETKKGEIVDGTITGAEFYNASGDKIYTFKDVDAKAEDIYQVYSFRHNPSRVMQGLMQGADTVTGSKYDDSLWGFHGNDKLNGKLGDDYMFGHQGNDTLTGGKGADSFALQVGGDHDTVTDFDAKGSDHDFVYIDYYLYDSLTDTRDGKNLVLTLDSGDQLTLENVRKSEMTIDHFHFF